MKNELIQQVQQTIHHHGVLPKGARILVAVSGGLDSVVLLDILYQLNYQKNCFPFLPPLRGGTKGRVKAPSSEKVTVTFGDCHFDLAVAHFNHQLRKSAKQDERFVKKLAKQYGLPCHVGRADVAAFAKKNKLSLEHAAREKRYDFLEQTAKQQKLTYVVTAHTQDDQAEGLLMRLLRGSGLRGLRATLPVLEMGPLLVVRPLIHVSRADIVKYAKAKKLKWCEDLTNLDPKFLRNQVRHQLLPFLEKNFQKEVKALLAQTARSAALDYAYIEREAKKVFLRVADKSSVVIASATDDVILRSLKDDVRIPKERSLGDARDDRMPDCRVAHMRWAPRNDRVILNQKKFMRLDPALQYRVLELALRTVHSPQSTDYSKSRGPSTVDSRLSHHAFLLLMKALHSKKQYQMPLTADIWLAFQYGQIIIERRTQITDQQWPLYLNQEVTIPGSDMRISAQLIDAQEAWKNIKKKKDHSRQSTDHRNSVDHGPWTMDWQVEYFDANQLDFPLILRQRRPGDRMIPFGQTKPKKVKEILINKKIPRWQRDWVLTTAADDQICWIPGVCRGNAGIVNENKNAIQLTIQPHAI